MRRITGEEARALREAATPGPWQVGVSALCPHRPNRCCNVYSENTSDVTATCGAGIDGLDAALIAAAPDLAFTVEALEAEASELRATLASERDAVVAWLLSRADKGWVHSTAGVELWSELRNAAAAIEAGAHVEGEP